MVKTIEVPIRGMDCAECTQHVQHAIARLPGVQEVSVFLAAEKAVVQYDPARLEMPRIAQAVAEAGYSVPEGARLGGDQAGRQGDFARRAAAMLGLVFGAVLLVVVVGEWLGLFEALVERVPFALGALLVAASGWPIFLNVGRAALKRQVTSHTLMTLGVLAALAIGQWATAAVVVFFMRVGDYVESFTADSARRALKDLSAMAPQTARVERDGVEVEVPAGQVRLGETVIVRPGEQVPVDGEVTAGHATVDQSSLTGEAMPAEAGPGSRVFAASLVRLGSVRVRTAQVGTETTFGRVVKLVEEAEANQANVQRFADRFTGYYLPVVAGLAALTFLVRRDPLATAAVLVVACSCSIALATPIAMLASIGAGARRGLMIKGGKYLEQLARVDVLLIDKTGTLTLGRPELVDIVPLNGLPPEGLLGLAASAERYSEHPLAQAVRSAARARGLALAEPEEFEAIPGQGVRARVDGHLVGVGSRRMAAGDGPLEAASRLEAQGKSLLLVSVDGEMAGILGAADTLRPEVPEALKAVRALGVSEVEVLTGDNEAAARALGERLGVRWRANLLPEDKIRIVRDYQARGRTVMMVGDGVNDAPALAQADVGVAMGSVGSDVALEAADVALLREDWALVPELLQIARRTMRVVKMNLVLTGVYNLAGLTLAALGLLPPVFAAAAQSLPDLGILANSSRLLRQGRASARGR